MQNVSLSERPVATWVPLNGFYIVRKINARMHMFFIVGKGEELFTVQDYKTLIQATQDHVRLEIIAQGMRPRYVYAFFSPGDLRGCIIFDTMEEEPYVYIRPLDFSYGIDVVPVYFNTN